MEFVALILLFAIALATRARLRRKGGTFSLPQSSIDNDFDTTSAKPTDSDVYADPEYLNLPGNICCDEEDDIFRSRPFGDDLCTDPAYSFLTCNIYHHHGDPCTSHHHNDWHNSSESDSVSSFRSQD